MASQSVSGVITERKRNTKWAVALRRMAKSIEMPSPNSHAARSMATITVKASGTYCCHCITAR